MSVRAVGRAPALLAIVLLVAPLPAIGDGVRGRLPLVVDPARQAYAFDDPRVLVRQIIFGLAHGVTLLARACLDVDDELRRPARAAYEEWLMRYGERIIDSEQGLATHYFGARAADATEEDLARALNLPPRLDLLPTPELLRDACATFPLALSRQRYDLDLVHALHLDQQRLGRAIEIRAAVGQCRQAATAAQLPALDAAFAAWEALNGALESSARGRWLSFIGDEAALRAWEASIATSVRQQLVSGSADIDAGCGQWRAELASPRASLSTWLGDGKEAGPSLPQENDAGSAEAGVAARPR